MSEEVRREVNKYGTIHYYDSTGQYHRLDGPAYEDVNGHKEWYCNGNLHRLDGPAVEFASGSKHWYYNGNLHRSDGPAIDEGDDYKAWYNHGILHRLDGPAREWSSGSKEWWIDGKYYTTQKEWERACCPSIETLKEMFKEVQHE